MCSGTIALRVPNTLVRTLREKGHWSLFSIRVSTSSKPLSRPLLV